MSYKPSETFFTATNVCLKSPGEN